MVPPLLSSAEKKFPNDKSLLPYGRDIQPPVVGVQDDKPSAPGVALCPHGEVAEASCTSCPLQVLEMEFERDKDAILMQDPQGWETCGPHQPIHHASHYVVLMTDALQKKR